MSVASEYKLEACVVDFDQALAAALHGADRLELCSRLETEGMTPSIDLTSIIIEAVKTPIRVMIRETEAGFESDKHVLVKMELAIKEFKVLPVGGFVIGLLKNKRIDQDATRRLIEVCLPFPITIHKAIDQSADVMDDLVWLNQFPTVDTILTSGGKPTAREGIEEILKMKAVFKGNIMAAGKITNDQLSELHNSLSLPWYHGRNILAHP
jgi:copper homeostasis protein